MQTISLGITMNHLSAIPVPILGGFIWKKFGYKWTFMTGAAILIFSLIAVSKIRTTKKNFLTLTVI